MDQDLVHNMNKVIWMLLAAGCQAPGDSGSLVETGDTQSPATDVVPLYDEATELEHALVFTRDDGAVVTRFADRGRDRHAREDEFQSYEHYLPLYWEYRSARVQIVDTVASGGGTLEISFVTEWKLSVAEFRAWYLGTGTVATYAGNYANGVVQEGPGVWDDDHEQISETGDQYRYSLTLDHAMPFDAGTVPLAEGQLMEIEISQFLAGVPSGRANYYGTALLYQVGVGGLVPWESDFSQRENSVPLDAAALSGGDTTLHAQVSAEPDNVFMQMATNTAGRNGQPFLRGRRVHHTQMDSGAHDEGAENGVFTELSGMAGPLYINTSCDSCHHRNGRASVVDTGETLSAWVFKVGTDDGSPDPALGRVLQVAGGQEGTVHIAEWLDAGDGLRSPRYGFSGDAPAAYSARLAPSLVGMGLLEAIAESTILEWHDPHDADGDGISGRAQRSLDPLTGDTRLGRFGWKAGASSLTHQIAAALNTDMGVMTSVLPDPDCGSAQSDCGESGAELSDAHLDDLVRYVALLGVPARRDVNDPVVVQGEQVFADVGCESCHRSTLTTSPYHPLAELRDQTVHPYSDLLLHDMGEGLADTLGEGLATGAEWRTTPLWGLGLGACVTGGVVGDRGSEVCDADASYLHDGRARTLDEAIRWHGGEGQASRDAYQALSADDRDALLTFLESL